MTKKIDHDHILGLLCDLGIEGVEVNLSRRGDGLDIRADKAGLAPESKSQIEANAEEIVAFLRQEARDMAALKAHRANQDTIN